EGVRVRDRPLLGGGEVAREVRVEEVLRDGGQDRRVRVAFQRELAGESTEDSLIHRLLGGPLDPEDDEELDGDVEPVEAREPGEAVLPVDEVSVRVEDDGLAVGLLEAVSQSVVP